MNNDLISRSELIKAFDIIVNNSATNEWQTLPITHIKQIIENAPTVEAYPFEQVQELVKLNQQFAQEIENLKRPQGEWKVYGKQGGIPITDMCSNCRYEMMWYKNKYNFCPNCGAEMKPD